MTTREIADGLSDTLLCDPRILSVPERELLAKLLLRTRSNICTDKVTDHIASAVGEVVAERAYAVLGHSIVKRLLNEQAAWDGPGGKNEPFAGKSRRPGSTMRSPDPVGRSRRVQVPQPPVLTG